MGLFDPVEPIDSKYELWIREIISYIFPTWHGYTYDLDRLDVKGLPYYIRKASLLKRLLLHYSMTIRRSWRQ